MKVEIRKNNKLGANGGCRICGGVQDGWRAQPYIVYHKADNEKRGHNDPACSLECAKVLAERYRGEN